MVQPNLLNLLDFCKGIAITWIILLHSIKGWFGWQGVHLFIVISGFVLTYSCLNKPQGIVWKQWFIRRAERILPSYYITVFAGFLILLCFHKHPEADISLLKSSINLVLDVLLLRNFSYKYMFGNWNSSLWYVSLIIGFYLIFPWLYAQVLRGRRILDYLAILLTLAIVEFIYRAISVYWLDGMPIGYGYGFLPIFPNSVSALTIIPDDFPFQLWTPFGFFPSRIGEFVLGMLGAIALIKNYQKFNYYLFNYWTAILGVVIWLSGNVLLYIGLWGWIFADYVIALGLTLWMINLAWFIQKKLPLLFSPINQLGILSYYIFLTHLIFMYMYALSYPLWKDSVLIQVFLLGCTAIAIGIASWLLMCFDKSKFSRLLIEKSIAKFLKP